MTDRYVYGVYDYAKHLFILGVEAQKKIQSSKILVIGLSGIGAEVTVFQFIY